MVAMGEFGQFEMAENIQWGEEIVLPRKAYDMWLLKKQPVSRGR